jgi:hypothetical protein
VLLILNPSFWLDDLGVKEEKLNPELHENIPELYKKNSTCLLWIVISLGEIYNGVYF